MRIRCTRMLERRTDAAKTDKHVRLFSTSLYVTKSCLSVGPVNWLRSSDHFATSPVENAQVPTGDSADTEDPRRIAIYGGGHTPIPVIKEPRRRSWWTRSKRR